MKIIKRHTRTRIQIHTYTKKRGRKKKKKRKKIRAILQYTLKRLIFVLLTLSPFRFRSRFSNCPRFLPRKFQEKEKNIIDIFYITITTRQFFSNPSLTCILFCYTCIIEKYCLKDGEEKGRKKGKK